MYLFKKYSAKEAVNKIEVQWDQRDLKMHKKEDRCTLLLYRDSLIILHTT
jgi:hypothetical protein